MSRDGEGAHGAGDSMKASDRGEAPGWNIDEPAGTDMAGSAENTPLDDIVSTDGNSAPVTRSGGIALPLFGKPSKSAASERSAVGMGRREALKIMGLAAAAGASGVGVAGCAPDDLGPDGTGADLTAGQPTAGATNPNARGWPWDPDLVAPTRPWDLLLTEDERAGLAVLADVIIPADNVSPAASQVGAVDYIDEWVSAPYDGMKRDLVLVRGGLVWLDQESENRFGASTRFRALTTEQKHAICDDICYRPDVAPENMVGYRFFSKVRDLTATAFYTSDEGMQDIGYIGNIPLPEWGPPPPEVLAHLGLETGE